MADAQPLPLRAHLFPVGRHLVPVEEHAVVAGDLQRRDERRVDLPVRRLQVLGRHGQRGGARLGPVEPGRGLHHGGVAPGADVGQEPGHHLGHLAPRRLRGPQSRHPRPRSHERSDFTAAAPSERAHLGVYLPTPLAGRRAPWQTQPSPNSSFNSANRLACGSTLKPSPSRSRRALFARAHVHVHGAPPGKAHQDALEVVDDGAGQPVAVDRDGERLQAGLEHEGLDGQGDELGLGLVLVVHPPLDLDHLVLHQ